MRIIKPSLWVLRITTFLFLFIVKSGCKKIDTLQPQINITIAEERFFNSHRSADPIEKVLVDFIRTQNNKKHFLDKTIKQIGYPYWNKAFSINKKNSREAGRGNSDSLETIYYIPFVRDSQNYVNASLIIQINQTDTSFHYLCDWQYKNKIHGSTTNTTAENYALLFMLLDSHTLGHKNLMLLILPYFRHLYPKMEIESYN